MTFEQVCRRVETIIEADWRTCDEIDRMERLEKEKKAIMGYEEEMESYKKWINEIILTEGLSDSEYPPWYMSLEEGIFNELYGLAGIAPWAYDQTEEYRNSSSAKLIGDKLYCLIDGVSKLQPQTVNDRRREQLKRAFLMAAPRERLENGFHEVYLRNGIRITIYSGEKTKEGQDVMVFRKYLLRELTFEKLVDMQTIPKDAVRLFKIMVKIGFNVIFAGPVRSGKTTFMQVWQRYEDPYLEGLAISTDCETPWHKIMPSAPLMQLVADGKELENITKSLLRGDNDYVLLEEMRDAQAYNIALEITSTGTHRSKATVHTDDPVNLPYKIASKIREKYGGDIAGIIIQIFSNFNYILEFCQVEGDRSVKKLNGIWEYCYDAERDLPSVHQICRYEADTNRWTWQCHIGKDKNKMRRLYPSEFLEMEEVMKDLEGRNPIIEGKVIYPRYYKPQIVENPERCDL